MYLNYLFFFVVKKKKNKYKLYYNSGKAALFLTIVCGDVTNILANKCPRVYTPTNRILKYILYKKYINYYFTIYKILILMKFT